MTLFIDTSIIFLVFFDKVLINHSIRVTIVH